MIFNFNWKVNLEIAIKYKLLWIEKPLKTLIASIITQSLFVASVYIVLFLPITILLKGEFNFSDTTITVIIFLITLYFLVSILNMNILYKVKLTNMDWHKIEMALKEIGLKTVFFINKDKCLVAYTVNVFKSGRQIVIIKNENEYLVNQKISNGSDIFPLALFATYRLVRNLKRFNV